MNDAEIRRRLQAAIGEYAYPPDLSARAAVRLREPVEQPRAAWLLAAVATALAIALVATIVLGSNALRHRVSVPVATPPPSGSPTRESCTAYTQYNQQTPSIKMMSSSIGWAAGGLRTTDGGATWRDMSPAALRSGMPAPAVTNRLYPPGFKDFYLDASHGWEFRTYGSSGACFDRAEVFSTSDGGQAWRQSQAIALALPAGWDAVPVSIQFIDANHGWLELYAGQLHRVQGFVGPVLVPARQQTRIYATSDGGLNWRLLSTLKAADFGVTTDARCEFGLGNVALTSIGTGTIEVSCAGQAPKLLVTADGGKTWVAKTVDVSFSALCPCSTQFDHVFDSEHLIVNVTGGSSAATLITADGGQTWQALSMPGSPYVLAVDYVDLGDWWAVVTEPSWQKGQPTNDWLYRTADGGRTWTLVQTGLPLGYPVDELDFIDAQHGLAAQMQGASTGPPIGPGEEILVTSDGGRTWRVVTEQFMQPA